MQRAASRQSPNAASRQSPNTFARALFAALPPRYDRLANILSLGQDRRWRHEMIDQIAIAHPTTVLDVATGPAGVALELADRTDANIVGIDLSPDMLAQGRRHVAAAGRDGRIGLVLGQAEHLPFPDASFDAVTFTYLLRYVADPAATIVELARVVKAGGSMASLEFAVPPRRFWRGWWWLYTRLVLPLAGAALGGRAWFAVGRFLGPNITSHYRRFPVSTTIAMWEAAGLTDVGWRRMSLGGGLVMWGRQAEARHGGGVTES
jgi:demethylmenaquinone methyltransferase/2-methoxy-6-polyprenyl-1,4-benzoquinol methylase